jgi:hypothetical protein
LIGAALYAGLEDYGETVELSDPGRHRDYWHRVWAGRFEAGSRRLEGELTYTSTLAPRGNDRNARLDAKVETRPKDRSAMTQLARVRAGMEFSLAALQRLTEELSPGVENAPELLDAALTAETFRDRMSMAVRLAFAVRGRDGESFGLWSYPSFKRARLAMMQPAEILETGNVSSFREISGELVVPVTLHVLATATRERDQRDGEDADDAGAEQIDGQSVIGRYKAGFYPVRLVAESPAS